MVHSIHWLPCDKESVYAVLDMPTAARGYPGAPRQFIKAYQFPRSEGDLIYGVLPGDRMRIEAYAGPATLFPQHVPGQQWVGGPPGIVALTI